jgi:hypothetical protein
MMKKSIVAICLAFSFLMFFMISCSKSSADQQTGGTAPPGSDCDTVGMKYATDVVPILQSHCYGCHGNGNTAGSGGISLDGYTDLKKYADNGFLKGNITHAPGYIGMPYGLPKLDDCTINKILDWIDQGSPNN